MNWVMQCFKKYVVFSGRARRREYWSFTLFCVIVGVLFQVVATLGAGIDGAEGATIPSIAGNVFCAVTFLPGLAVCIRRLHDIGKSGWWVLISLVPCVGGIILLVFTLLDSQSGSNTYGPNPKGA